MTPTKQRKPVNLLIPIRFHQPKHLGKLTLQIIEYSKEFREFLEDPEAYETGAEIARLLTGEQRDRVCVIGLFALKGRGAEGLDFNPKIAESDFYLRQKVDCWVGYTPRVAGSSSAGRVIRKPNKISGFVGNHVNPQGPDSPLHSRSFRLDSAYVLATSWQHAGNRSDVNILPPARVGPDR